MADAPARRVRPKTRASSIPSRVRQAAIVAATTWFHSGLGHDEASFHPRRTRNARREAAVKRHATIRLICRREKPSQYFWRVCPRVIVRSTLRMGVKGAGYGRIEEIRRKGGAGARAEAQLRRCGSTTAMLTICHPFTFHMPSSQPATSQKIRSWHKKQH
jgi:hypothetical protein